MGFQIVGNGGQRDWSVTRDAEGHREYRIIHRVESDSSLDGPAMALVTPGLPVPGSPWLIDNDVDLWAWFRGDATAKPVISNEPNRHFDIEQVASTRPPDNDAYDPSESPNGPENPLLQPAKISGGFTKGKVEATHNWNGMPILTSSHEALRGPQVEFDANDPSIRIQQNVATLNLPLLCLMVDTVNYLPLWGLPPRCVKLSSVSWERKFTGQGGKYYERTLEFDVKFKTFDRVLLDEGRKALNGRWDATSGNWVLVNIAGAVPNPRNPGHFSQFKDRAGENIRCVLNGAGLPSSVMVGANVAARPYIVGDSVTYLGSVYICVVSNVNVNPATSSAGPAADRKWIKKVGGDSDFDDATNYVVGNIVVQDGDYYIANTDSPAGTPFGGNWTFLGEITDQGEWVGKGQAVPSGGPGYVYVTYYLGTNMLLLGIPLTF